MILCCGEALIDMLPRPSTDGADGFVPHSGGAIFNTAIALGRLGAPVGMMTGLSSDMFGAQLMRDLAASHVDLSQVVRTDRPTTLAFVQLTEGQATYTFFDENSAGRMLRDQDLPPVSDEVSALYLGGISLACEPGAMAYEALALREKDRRVIALDPNIRPGFVQDEARYRARLDRLLACADIVKVSDEDLDWIYPGNATLEDKAARLRGLGAKLVILTRGASGARAWLPDGTAVQMPGHRVSVVDTVGAGDTFNAGVLASLYDAGRLTRAGFAGLTGAELSDALDLGVAVAAQTVQRAGANPPWRHEMPDR